MLKLIVKVPAATDAKVLMQAALGLASYKQRHPRQFSKEYDSSVFNYDKAEVEAYEPEYVVGSRMTGVAEYEVDGGAVDVFFMEVLSDLQKVLPFEMYFENRGQSKPLKWHWSTDNDWGEIRDRALDRLFFQGVTW